MLAVKNIEVNFLFLARLLLSLFFDTNFYLYVAT